MRLGYYAFVLILNKRFFVKYSLIFALCFGVAATAHAGAFGDLLSKAREITSVVNDTTSTVNGIKGILPTTESGTPSGNSADAKAPRQVEKTPELPLILQSTVNVEDRIVKNYDEYVLLLSRPLEGGDAPIKATITRRLEGKFIHAQFKHAEDESTLKVWRDYQAELGAKGYKIEFICDKPCAESASLWYTKMKLIVNHDTDRYLVARKGNKTIAMAMGEYSGRPYSAVDYIEVPEADPSLQSGL